MEPELYNSPLKETKRRDFFDTNKILSDLEEFEVNYFYNGKRLGKNSKYIYLFVVTWIVDYDENFFIRYCTYSGTKSTWKEKITDQLRELMADIEISGGIIKGRLRYFEVETEKHLQIKDFENKFLELQHKMKTARE